MKATRTLIKTLALTFGIVLLTVPIAATRDNPPAPHPSDGINFAALTANASGIYLGAYTHAKTATFGLAGGTQTREDVSRPVLWRAVASDSNTLTLFSEYVLDNSTFSDSSVSGSLNYATSTAASVLSAAPFTTAFTSNEKNSSTLLATDIFTSLYEPYTGDNLDSLQVASLNWPVSTRGQLSLPWAKTLYDYSPATPRLFTSTDGSNTDANLGSALARQATLRDGVTPAPFWTRSPHLSAPLNEALYVDESGTVQTSRTDFAYGLRPLAAVDTERVLLAQPLVASPQNSFEVAAGGARQYGTISTDSDYFASDNATNYKLTLVNDNYRIVSLSTSAGADIAANGSTTLATSAGSVLELTADLTGAAQHLAYKIVRGPAASREIVAYGISSSHLLSVPTVGLDEVSPLPQGDYTVYVWSQVERQAASTEGSVPFSFTLTIDKDTPTTSASPAPTGGWLNTKPTITLAATDNLSGISHLDYSLDDTDDVSIEDDHATFSLVSDGIHSLTYCATDKAGNVEATHTAVYAVDTTAPLSTAKASGSYQPQTFSFMALDPIQNAFDGKVSGLASVSYRINNGPVQTTTGDRINLALNADGSYLITFWASDKAGNSEVPQTVSYLIRKQVAATSLAISHESLTLAVGEFSRLRAAFAPDTADKGIIWASSNPTVASVAADGTVRAHKAGTVRITAKASYGSAQDVITVTVENKVSSIAASHGRLTLTVGKTVSLPIVAYARDISKVTLNWKTTKYGAATVINAGKTPLVSKGSLKVAANKATALKIKANKVGKTTVTVTSRNGQRYSVSITVVKKSKAKAVKKLKITSLPKGKRLERATSKRLKVAINPKSATNVIAKWKSSNPKVVAVDATGKVTAIKTGKATITVKVGKRTAKVKLTVVKWSK